MIDPLPRFELLIRLTIRRIPDLYSIHLRRLAISAIATGKDNTQRRRVLAASLSSAQTQGPTPTMGGAGGIVLCDFGSEQCGFQLQGAGRKSAKVSRFEVNSLTSRAAHRPFISSSVLVDYASPCS